MKLHTKSGRVVLGDPQKMGKHLSPDIGIGHRVDLVLSLVWKESIEGVAQNLMAD